MSLFTLVAALTVQYEVHIPFQLITFSSFLIFSRILAFGASSTSCSLDLFSNEPCIVNEIPEPAPDLLKLNIIAPGGPDLCEESLSTYSSAISTQEIEAIEITRGSLLGSPQHMPKRKRAVYAAITTLLSYLSIFSLHEYLRPGNPPLADETREEARWIASSHSWIDRKVCRWFGICGALHWRSRIHMDEHNGREEQAFIQGSEYLHTAWRSGGSNPDDWAEDERVMRQVPQYVLDYAPFVHLYSGEQFWPCDIAEHLLHVTPYLNYTQIQSRSHLSNLTNLNELNRLNKGRFVYLQSDDDVEERPEWLEGEKNIPSILNSYDGSSQDQDVPEVWDGRVDGELLDEAAKREGWYDVGEGSYREQGGERPNPSGDDHVIPGNTVEGEEHLDELESRAVRGEIERRSANGRSDAPAVLVVVDKGHGIVDAFWFYFYSFNLGNIVFNIRFGNHVGDWEHSLVRFQNGKPKAVFFSEHNFGEAYSYDAVEKIGKRPVIYSATGTHAMYAKPGTHQYILPWGLLHDETDRGPLWDPALNSHMYTYDYLSDTLRSSSITPYAPTEWFYFAGHWGDKFYPLEDRRQYRFAGQYHYVNGPLGPRFKNLGRKKVCQGRNSDPCIIKNWIGDTRRAKRWKGVGTGEEVEE